MISEVMYERVPNCTVKEASEYYFHQNALGMHPSFTEAYEAYETKQASIRAQAFRHYMDKNPSVHPDTRTAMFGASAMSDDVILVAKI